MSWQDGSQKVELIKNYKTESMKEKSWDSLIGEVAGSFGVEKQENSRVLSLGEEGKQVRLLFFDNSVAVSYHLGHRVAEQRSPVSFDGITDWKITDSQVLFRRQIAGFDETLKIFANGEFVLASTDPSDWEDS